MMGKLGGEWYPEEEWDLVLECVRQINLAIANVIEGAILWEEEPT